MTSKHKPNLKSQTTDININLLAQFLLWPVLVSSTRSILHSTLMQNRPILGFMTKKYTKAAKKTNKKTASNHMRDTENTIRTDRKHLHPSMFSHLSASSERGWSRFKSNKAGAERQCLEGCGIMKVLVVIIAQVCCVTEALCCRGWKALRNHNPQLCSAGPRSSPLAWPR